MIHDIDLVLHLIGEEPSHIHAAGASVISSDLDICNARMEFPKGAVANLTASRISTFGMRKFRIFAQQAYIALDLKEKSLEHYRLFESADQMARAGAHGLAIPFGDRGQVLSLERRTETPRRCSSSNWPISSMPCGAVCSPLWTAGPALAP